MLRTFSSLTSCLALALLLVGCGLSPQKITIEPRAEIDDDHANVGRNVAVQVSARDTRDSEAFGTRGGVYPETSLIRPANEITEPLRKMVARGLQSQGFNAYNPGEDATRLEVQIEEFSYVPEEGSVVKKVEVAATLVAVAKRDNVTHTGRYQSKVVHQQPVTPSARRNADMLNDVLNRSLGRLLADQKLLAFLAGEDVPETDSEEAPDSSSN